MLIRDFTRGGQTALHGVRMLSQVSQYIWRGCVLFILLFNAAWLYFKTSTLEKTIYLQSLLAKFYVDMGSPQHEVSIAGPGGQSFPTTAQQVVTHPNIIYFKNAIEQTALFGLKLSLGICLGIVLLTIIWLIFSGARKRRHQFRRGIKVASSAKLARKLKLSRKASTFKLANVPLVKNSETKHILISGSSGTGKTVAITELLDQIRAKGQRAIIYDKMGTFVKHYYRESKDVILNPMDARSTYWDVWAEGTHSTNFDTLANALIPAASPNTDRTWSESARTLFSVVANKLYQQGERDLSKLLKLLLNTNVAELSEFVKDTPAEPLVSDKAIKFALSIVGTLSPALKPLALLSGCENESVFSIRDWVANESDDSWLFISSRADQHATLKPLISAWIETATNSLLSLTPSPERRIWTVLDELPSLQNLPSLPIALAESRQFGGCMLLSIQTIAQLRKIYGKDGAEALSGLCNTRLNFRTPDPVTADWVSNSLGKSEMDETREGFSYGAHQIRDGVSISSQTSVRPVVMPSEILSLEDLYGYLRLTGNWPIARVRVKPKHRKIIAESFIEKSMSTPPIKLPGNEQQQDSDSDDQSGGPDAEGLVAVH